MGGLVSSLVACGLSRFAVSNGLDFLVEFGHGEAF
jgi:hypothetical protein